RAGEHGLAAHEHVVAPDQKAEDGNGHAGERNELVAKNALAREHPNDLADHAERRNDHDVHGGMRVKPEEVLKQYRVAAERWIEDADTDEALHDQHQQGY